MVLCSCEATQRVRLQKRYISRKRDPPSTMPFLTTDWSNCFCCACIHRADIDFCNFVFAFFVLSIFPSFIRGAFQFCVSLHGVRVFGIVFVFWFYLVRVCGVFDFHSTVLFNFYNRNKLHRIFLSGTFPNLTEYRLTRR